MNSLCLPISLEARELDQLDHIIQRSRPLQRDSSVYRAGETFSCVYAVRSGSVKCYYVNDEGQEQVTGFFLPGEIFGFDGIGHNKYTNSASAMETSSICEIPFSKLEKLSAQIPSLQRYFFQLMSREITNDQQLITMLSKNSAEERVATLMLSLSERHSTRHLSGTHLRLPMSRADIGNYLGLTVETVSRVLSRFQKQDMLKVDKKEIEIIDMTKLKDIANS
jgi:CRP/FNR family transcriptional regulator